MYQHELKKMLRENGNVELFTPEGEYVFPANVLFPDDEARFALFQFDGRNPEAAFYCYMTAEAGFVTVERWIDFTDDKTLKLLGVI